MATAFEMDWNGNRRNEKFTYRIVDWETFAEVGEIGNILSGNLYLSALNDMRATGTFEYDGGSAPNPNDLVRIYYSFTDDYGRTLDPHPLATLFINYSEYDSHAVYSYKDGEYVSTGVRVHGTANGDSVLKVMQDKIYGKPFTIPNGLNYVQTAKTLVESLGLRTNNPQPSERTRSRKADGVMEADSTYQNIVNYLLNCADYSACYPNSMGEVQITPYTDIDKRSVVWTFANDANSIIEDGITSRNNWQTVPNVCRCYYASDVCSCVAVAKNYSGSRVSLQERDGRELTIYEDTSSTDESDSSISGETPEDIFANLKTHAINKLKNNSNETDYIVIRHPYVPISPNDAIAAKYSPTIANGINWNGTVMSMDISLTVGTSTQTEARRFIDDGMNIAIDDSESSIIWRAEE